jgi:hypothetical protein
VTRAAVFLALLALPSTAAAQAPPPCAPEKVSEVTLTSQERGEDAPLVATHEVYVVAEIQQVASQVVMTPQAGVAVLDKNSAGTGIIIFAPTTPELTVTVTWRQSADPSNDEETARCTATRVVTLPVLPANPARGVKQPNPGPASLGDYTFAVAPALRRPNLSPLEITIRSTSAVRFPRANERVRTMVVPMRGEEQLRYKTRLPNYAYATFPQLCRFWWLSCGPVNSHIGQLNVLNGGRPDLDGSNAILRPLAASQPLRWAARYGLVVTAFPGAGKNRPYGYDVQVRQSGRLLARVRRAGRCREIPRNGGSFHSCTLARKSTLLR